MLQIWESQTAKRTMAADIRKKCNDGVCMLQIFLPLCSSAKRPSRLPRVMKSGDSHVAIAGSGRANQAASLWLLVPKAVLHVVHTAALTPQTLSAPRTCLAQVLN
jgi:hypothetical protein